MEEQDLRFVIVGHVDHGKSTLIGRLLYDTGSLPEDKYQSIKEAVEALGREFKFAYLMDHLEEERSKEATIDTAQTFFKSKKRRYTIIDAPGHVEFVKNMITGASQAEAALLIVDVSQGVQEQTRRHAYILSMLGIEQVIVVLNKMDLVNYSQKKFVEVRTQVSDFLKSIGITPSLFIPISAVEGDFVAKKTDNLSWYDGLTILEGLDTFKKKVVPIGKPLRLPIQDIYDFDGEKIAVGQVVSGSIRKGDKIIILSDRKEVTIESLKEFGKNPIEAYAGKSIGFTISDSIQLRRGQIISHQKDLPNVTTSFKGHLFWMDDKPYEKGESITFKCATQETQCNLIIEKVFDSSTLEVMSKGEGKIENRQVANVTIKTSAPVVIENFNYIPELGRFVLVRKDCCAGGIITG